MRRLRVFLGAIAVVAALTLIPAAGAQAATIPTATCTASSSLQIGLLGASLPTKPTCTTALIGCPAGTCIYRTTAIVINGLSVNSGARSTTFGLDRTNSPVIGTTTCGGTQSCTTVSQIVMGQPNQTGPSGAVGICSWNPAIVSLGLGVFIGCKLEQVQVIFAGT